MAAKAKVEAAAAEIGPCLSPRVQSAVIGREANSGALYRECAEMT